MLKAECLKQTRDERGDVTPRMAGRGAERCDKSEAVGEQVESVCG